MNGMDRKIEKKKGIRFKHILVGSGLVLLFMTAYLMLSGKNDSKLKIDADRLTIVRTIHDVFQDYIAVQGNVEPIQTFFIDAVEGGRVEEILKEEGSLLKKGDVILRLSNNNLILEISNNEAQVSRSVSELRNARVLMEQQLLNSKIQIYQLSTRVRQLKRAYEKNISLHEDQHISDEEFQQSKEDYETAVALLDLYRENLVKDSIYRGIQVSTLEESVERMSDNLRLIMKRLDNLNVKSPVDGELAFLEPEIGQVISYGTRIGTVNNLDAYKLRVEIDEFYVSRITRGLTGYCEFAGKEYAAKTVKIYPEIRNSRFAVDMVFTGEIPPGIRIGQNSQIKMELGESGEGLLLQKGTFFQRTGGQWVYVVDKSGDYAVKRKIAIGRQNPRYFEILDGLMEGEEVIISNYENFNNADKLILKKKPGLITRP
jgi:HlyD family secretion protein